jgi:hypothetical protein
MNIMPLLHQLINIPFTLKLATLARSAAPPIERRAAPWRSLALVAK